LGDSPRCRPGTEISQLCCRLGKINKEKQAKGELLVPSAKRGFVAPEHLDALEIIKAGLYRIVCQSNPNQFTVSPTPLV